MAAASVQNPPTQTESKSAKKKKAKAQRTDSPAPTATLSPEKAVSISGHDRNQDDASESAHVREVQKNIRNVKKKITLVSKTDSLIAEHKDKSLEQLVAAKIINNDQKTQVLKKPALEAQLRQLEEQLAQYQKIDNEYRAKAAAIKSEVEKALTDKYEKEKADAIAEIKEKAEADSKKALHDGFLVLSQFLRLAANRRTEAPDSQEDQNLALEGVLLSVYTGDEAAVDSMLKLYEGTDDTAKSVSGEHLQTTFATVKSLAAAHSAPLFENGAAETEIETSVEAIEAPQTDPTIANAGLTEIDAGTDITMTNDHVTEEPVEAVNGNAEVADNAANAAAENQWDNPEQSLSTSQEWVDVKRPQDAPAAETEKAVASPSIGIDSMPAPLAHTQSWADDQPDTPTEVQIPTDNNDGFHQVQRQQRGNGNRGEGGHRGGNRGHYGGRGGNGGGGFRGEGRGRGGRGRGGSRGGGGARGGFRQPVEASS